MTYKYGHWQVQTDAAHERFKFAITCIDGFYRNAHLDPYKSK